MNRKEKLVLIALACVFVLGVVFSIKDLNVSVMNTEERAAYDQQTEVLRTGLIDVNTANAMELQLLKGIGTTKADAIVKYRETNGSFSKKEDIMNVPGIGPATYEKIKDRLQITEKSMDESKQEQHHSEEERININRASQLQLEKLPGIGPVKARSIVEYRELNGDFNDLPDLILVKGIGEKTFEQIKPMITISH
ncbi:MAG: competence protein ComEA [Thermotogaceae bacterium]|jgi:competence protein ComEA|nr:competence protein ComEA [Thermotogaceae bacterium]